MKVHEDVLLVLVVCFHLKSIQGNAAGLGSMYSPLMVFFL